MSPALEEIIVHTELTAVEVASPHCEEPFL
jgi:hypothetical protein